MKKFAYPKPKIRLLADIEGNEKGDIVYIKSCTDVSLSYYDNTGRPTYIMKDMEGTTFEYLGNSKERVEE